MLICSVTVDESEYLIATNIDSVHVQWNGGSLGSENGVMERILHNGSYTSNTLIFNPLLPPHGGGYTCLASINISSINLRKIASDTRNVIVQSKFSNGYKFLVFACEYLLCTHFCTSTTITNLYTN